MSDRKHEGINAHRFADNPEELRFAQAWQAEHAWGRGDGLLPWIMSNDDRPAVLTDRDEVVAASVVQWLGSPVGRHFLARLGYVKEPSDV